MFRFTIRDVLWLTVVVALVVALWVNRRQHGSEMEIWAEEVRQLKKESKVWESRARSLQRDAMTGSNKNTDVEFIKDGLRYIPRPAPAMSQKASPDENQAADPK